MFCLILLLPFLHLQGQTYRPPLPPTPPAGTPILSPDVNQRILLRDAVTEGRVGQDDVHIRSVTQEVQGQMRHLRGAVLIETTTMRLTADEVDYNEETGDSEARGHVHFEHLIKGEKLDCDHAEYNLSTETGKFYDVSGTATTRIQARPGLLTTTNPFYFQGDWAERLKDHYILHDGFITDCKMPRAWWRVKSPSFLVVPGDHATTHKAVFYIRQFPLMYFPYYYKSLKKEPRKSGFLTPNIGNSSTRGAVVGLGYFWAINRSYDLTYRARYFTTAGLAHHVDFRGDPNDRTVFDFQLDGTQERRPLIPSGVQILAHARSYLGNGWEARGELNYISSFGFLQNFTDSFNEAVYSETHSTAFVTKHWSDFGFTVVAQRNVNYQDTLPGNEISVRKLPEADFRIREYQFPSSKLPSWVAPFSFSMESTAGLLSRSQPLFQTRQFTPRLDLAPHVTTALHLGGFQIVPTVGIRETFYDSSIGPTGTFFGQDLLRNSRDATVDLIFPALARVFDSPKFLGATKVKHIIEPRITYKDVSGVNNFSQIIRFDETDILSNTNQVEFSLTNRLLAKDKNGTVSDLLSWQLWYDRYFDPTFGGAIVPGQRNVVQSELDITGYEFLNGQRRSSPVVSALRFQMPRVGFEWRTDYDPVLHKIVNSSATINGRFNQFFFSAAHTDLKTDPILAPSANQFRGSIGYGADGRRGLSYGLAAYYDFRTGVLQYTQAQVTYNTDCCGISVQFRRFDLITRDETQFRVAFAISNIGTFGTLKRQERIF